MKRIVQIIAMLIAFSGGICGIVAICIKAPRQVGDFDYLGMLVGILSLLILFTVGWQIYTIIDTQKLRKDYEKLNKKVEQGYDEMHLDLYRSIAETFYCGDMLEIGLAYFFQALSCVNENNKDGENKKVKEIEKQMLQIKNELTDDGKKEYMPQQLVVTYKNKMEYLEAVIKTGNRELIEWVSRFSVVHTEDPDTGEIKDVNLPSD